ncbi:MAG TPA: M48 family metalloprotease, partial [Usitatibacter sp.]|nr:M48 family metalloprotease [Usitatibacter sp.]
VIIKLAAEANDSGAIPIALWGALVAGVGYVGVFFGRMIKAAVARQREFLADASSVQFTRNPDGLVSALEKIGKEGTVLASAQAGEMSHMFFTQAIKPKMFSDLLATHPPIDQRIASIRGQPIVATAQTAGGIVDAVLAMVGKSTPEHVDHAMETLAALPASVKKMLETPEGARKVVYGYLFAADEATRLVQVRALVEAGDDLAAGAMDDMTKLLRQTGPAMRLPVLTLAAPALRQMEQPAKNTFLKAVDALIEADNEVTLDEFTLRTLLQRQLAAGAAKMERVKFRDIASVRADLDAILAALKGAASPQEAAKAKFDAKGVGAALDRLRVLAPLAKPQVIEECVKVVLADGKVSVAEMEMLRAVGMAIDCPLPPAIEATYSTPAYQRSEPLPA